MYMSIDDRKRDNSGCPKRLRKLSNACRKLLGLKVVNTRVSWMWVYVFLQKVEWEEIFIKELSVCFLLLHGNIVALYENEPSRKKENKIFLRILPNLWAEVNCGKIWAEHEIRAAWPPRVHKSSDRYFRKDFNSLTS